MRPFGIVAHQAGREQPRTSANQRRAAEILPSPRPPLGAGAPPGCAFFVAIAYFVKTAWDPFYIQLHGLYLLIKGSYN